MKSFSLFYKEVQGNEGKKCKYLQGLILMDVDVSTIVNIVMQKVY